MTTNTQNFLVELGCEELPPTALVALKNTFAEQVRDLLNHQPLTFTSIDSFATPRRLALMVTDLAEKQADKTIEKLGPAVAAAFDDEGNAKPAALGFAKSCGVDISELSEIETPKGVRLGIKQSVAGKSAAELIPSIVEQALTKLPVPKMMRWGAGTHQFSRPVKWLTMLHGEQVIDCSLYGVSSGRLTFGHRFYHPASISLKTADDYQAALLEAKVISSFEERKATIKQQIEKLADTLSAKANLDPALLDEVCALVEWPVAMIGEFDEAFLSVPQEALISTMAKNQKYFHLVNKQDKLVSKFIFISNIDSHKPQTVIKGNERVIRPRLADAKFFYEQDSKHSLTSRVDKLKAITFQKQLGSIFDKSQRTKAIALHLAKQLNLECPDLAHAADIAKADLVTDMVGEFPSLQGIMGRYYAKVDGESTEVCQAMDEIYMPRFAGDQLPETNTGLLLALADRIDTLVSIFAINQIPTGNKDPFALRRAALGILRIMIDKQLPLNLSDLMAFSFEQVKALNIDSFNEQTLEQCQDFVIARLKSMFSEQGISAQVIQSVLAVSELCPFDIDLRVQAVKSFSNLPEADSLSSANKRVANILAKETELSDKVDRSLFQEQAEQDLFTAYQAVEQQVVDFAKQQNYQQALSLLAGLQLPIDKFFDEVMVMADDPKIKANRIALVSALRNLFLAIADISHLQK